MLEFLIENEIISECYPEKECLVKGLKIENLGHVFEKLFCTLHGIKNYIPSIKLSIVKFWSDFVSLVGQMNEDCKEFMWDFAALVKKIDMTANKKSNLYYFVDDDLIAKILNFFD